MGLENQHRRVSDMADCPDWIQKPLEIVLGKLQKLDEVTTQVQLLVYKQQHLQEALEKLASKDAIIAEVVIKQARQDTGLKIITTIAVLLFPVLAGWNSILQQKIENLQYKITVLENKK